MDIIDERAKPIDRNLVKDFIARAPLSAQLVLLAAVLAALWYLKTHLHDLNVGRRERLNQRRRAGIPDSDTRPFRTAFLDAEAKRRAKEEEQRASVKQASSRRMQPSASMPNFQSPSVRRSTSSRALASPRAQTQFLAPSQSSTVGYLTPNKSRRSRASPSPFGLRPQPSSSTLRHEISSPPPQQRQRKRQHEDDDDDSQNASQAVEEKKQKLDQSDAPQQEMSRGQRRKRSLMPDDEEQSHDEEGQAAKRAKQEDSRDVGMQVDETPEDDQSSYMGPQDTQMDEPETSGRQPEDELKEAVDLSKRMRSPSVDTTAASSRGKSARKASRTVSADQLPPFTASSALSPEVKAKLAQKSHQPRRGETWKDPSGVRLRVNSQGVKEQLVAVKERRHKYNMPKGSKHPSANVMEERVVDKWLDELSYEDYKRQGLLAWQTEEDAQYEQLKLKKRSGGRSSSPNQDDSDGSIFFTRGASPSVSRFQSPARGPKRDSLSNIELLPNGRVKLPRSKSQHLTPRRSLATLESDSARDSAKKKKAIERSASSQVLSETEPEAPATASPAIPSQSEQSQGSQESKAASSSNQSPFAFPSTSTAPPTRSQSDSQKTSSSSSQPFSLNSASAPTAPKVTSSQTSSSAPAFSFGTSADKTSISAPSATPQAGTAPSPFSFGTSSTSAPATSSSEASKPAFSFGSSSAAPTPTPGASAAPASKPSFGSMDTKAASGSEPLSFNSPAPQSNPSTSSGFGFGSTPTSSAQGPSASTAAPATSNSGFSFGSATPSSAPSAAPGAFAFGAPAPSAPATPGGTFKFEMGSGAASTPGTGAPAASGNRSSRARANPSRRRI